MAIKAVLEAINKQRDGLDFFALVSMGLIPGVSSVRKFGHNEAVGVTYVDIWDAGTAYTFPTAAAKVRIAAGGNAADTAAGAGARKVKIYGLLADFTEANEEIVTAGVSASADSVNSYIRIYRAMVTDSGAYGASNTGAINIETNPGGTVLAQIKATSGQTQMAVYTVPANKTGILYDADCSIESAQTFDVKLTRRHGADTVAAPFVAPRIITEFHGLTNQAVHRDWRIHPEVLPAKSDIWASAKAGSAGSKIEFEFSLLLVDNA